MVFSTEDSGGGGAGRGGGTGLSRPDSVARSCLRGGLERLCFLDGQHPAPEILTEKSQGGFAYLSCKLFS